MKLLQQAPQQQGPGAGSSGWSGAPSSGLAKAGKSQALTVLEMQQEAERLLKQQQQQRAQQQRDRVSLLKCFNGFLQKVRMQVENELTFFTMISPCFSSTLACQWEAPPWAASG